jgi:DNA-binding NarL/FixJ family response regulator
MPVVGSISGGPTAVIADRLPLVRVGLAASLLLEGVTTVGDAVELAEGVDAARRTGATLLVLGAAGEADAGLLAAEIGRLGSTRVVVVVARADRRSLAAMFEAGADAVALHTIAPEQFGALVRRVLAGERSVDPALMSVLLEMTRDRAVPGRLGATVMARARRDEPARYGSHGVPLTTKEHQVLNRLAHGDSNAEIATALFVSPATIKTHLAHIYTKLGVGSRHGATSRATALGLLP